MARQKILRILCLTLVGIIFCCTLPVLGASNALNIAIDDDYPPYSFRNETGDLCGITIDQWHLWEKKTGQKVNFIIAQRSQAEKLLQNDQADIVDMCFYGDISSERFIAANPYSKVEAAIFFDRSIRNIENINALKNFKVGVKKGDYAEKFLHAYGIYDLVEFDSFKQVIEAAQNRQILVFVMDKPPAQFLLQQADYEGEFRNSAPLYSSQLQRITAQNRQEIFDLVTTGFGSISTSEYDHIEQLWIGPPLANKNVANRLITAFVIISLLIIALIVWNNTLNNSVRRKTAELSDSLAALRISEEHYKHLLENLTVGVVVRDPSGKAVLYNQAYLDMLHIKEDDMHSLSEFALKLIDEDGNSLPVSQLPFYKAIALKAPIKNYLLGAFHKNYPQVTWVQINTFPEFGPNGELIHVVSTFANVTELKQAAKLQQALFQISETDNFSNNIEDVYLSVHHIISQLIPAKYFYIALYNEATKKIEFPYSTDSHHRVKSSRPAGQGLTEYVLRTGQALFVDRKQYLSMLKTGEIDKKLPSLMYWHGVPLKTGASHTFGILAVQAYDDGFPYSESDRQILNFISSQVALVIERKQSEERLIYISLHDSLTNLYNRTYFEQEIKKLEEEIPNHPIGIVIFDVDGLKLVNDTLGHEKGDMLLIKSANILRQLFPPDISVCRIGGDEFAAIVPEFTKAKINRLKIHLAEILARENSGGSIPVNISMGFSATTKTNPAIRDAFREADNLMYRDKLHRHMSTRGRLLQTLKQMLAERDYITEGHADRLQALALELATEAGLAPDKMADLKLFAQFHDIGKVGIPDRILNKPEKLTAEEQQEIQLHCEIGQRIAQSSPELMPIADLILKHQEWWNGKGYPLGLAGDKIPLECRILAIVDAFDAMTNDRPYRKALSEKTALGEIIKNAETQFDPHLAKIFVTLMSRKSRPNGDKTR